MVWWREGSSHKWPGYSRHHGISREGRTGSDGKKPKPLWLAVVSFARVTSQMQSDCCSMSLLMIRQLVFKQPDIPRTRKGQRGNGRWINTPSVTRSNTTLTHTQLSVAHSQCPPVQTPSLKCVLLSVWGGRGLACALFEAFPKVINVCPSKVPTVRNIVMWKKTEKYGNVRKTTVNNRCEMDTWLQRDFSAVNRATCHRWFPNNATGKVTALQTHPLNSAS